MSSSRRRKRLSHVQDLVRRWNLHLPDLPFAGDRDFLREWKRLNPDPPAYPLGGAEHSKERITIKPACARGP